MKTRRITIIAAIAALVFVGTSCGNKTQKTSQEEVTTVEQSANRGLEGYRNTFPNNYLYELGSGDKSTATNNSSLEEYALLSFFGRINYSFKDRYLLEANLRYDGSSRFADGHRWGLFPSVSAGWI